MLPRLAGTARTSLPDEDALVVEPEVEALVGLARCARRLRDGDDPLAVRRAIDRVRADARHAGYDYLSVQCLGRPPPRPRLVLTAHEHGLILSSGSDYRSTQALSIPCG